MTGGNFENRTLFHGDNLEFLRAMNSESIDLIATDPPFNKNKEFYAASGSAAEGASFQDRWTWEKDVHPTWQDKLKDDFPKLYNVIEGSNNSYGKDMGAFLCFMAVRLLEMKRILKDTGSIYLHCDPTASHYLKELMDAIFGRKNFRNDIIWSYKTGGQSKRWFGKKHDNILFYSKTDDYVFNLQKERSYNRGGKPYRFKDVEEFEDENGQWYTMAGMRDVWELNAIGRTSKERTGYPTQKPLALYERIIKASSNPDDIVLDPFCGCATTLVAAEKLGRQWVGIDLWDKAKDVVIDRIKKECEVLGPDGIGQPGTIDYLLIDEQIVYSKEAPERTDDKAEVVPFLKVKMTTPEPPGQRMSRDEMMAMLVEQNKNSYGIPCKGCDRYFDDERYLQLDHNTPRSQGGINHISNRMLLCAPCNIAKSDTLTLKGLRQKNKKDGFMANNKEQRQ